MPSKSLKNSKKESVINKICKKNLIFIDYDNEKIQNRMQELSSYMKNREK